MTNQNGKESDLETLTELFRQAGASNAEQWARSQINEGINQLGRFSFLKSISSEWLNENDTVWVDNQIEFDYTEPGDAFSQLPKALKEMLDKKVNRESIIDLIRVIQYKTLMHVCSTIDGVYEADTPVNNWGLYELDEEEYNPVRPIGGLHESLLEFDPSGKEMRPRECNGCR